MPILGGTPRPRAWEWVSSPASASAALLASSFGAGAGAGGAGVDAGADAVARARRHAQQLRGGGGGGGGGYGGGVAAPSALLQAALGHGAAPVDADELRALSSAYERARAAQQASSIYMEAHGGSAGLRGGLEGVQATDEAVAAASARARAYARAEAEGVGPGSTAQHAPEADAAGALARARALLGHAAALPGLPFEVPRSGVPAALEQAALSATQRAVADELRGVLVPAAESAPVLALRTGASAGAGAGQSTLLLGPRDAGRSVVSLPAGKGASAYPTEPLLLQEATDAGAAASATARARPPSLAALARPKRTYRLTLRTGRAARAGTSAAVSVCLRGAGGRSSGTRRLPSGEGLFENGSEDVFWLDAPDLGPLEALEVSHDNGGDSPGWLLAGVSVMDMSTSIEKSFACGAWLDAERGDGATFRTLYADGGATRASAQHAGAAVGTAPLVVTIHTADEYGAGTDADVAVEACGRVAGLPASSGMWRLRNDGKNFMRGAVASFVLTGLPRLDKVTAVKVGLEAAGAEPRWRLDKVAVLDAESGVETAFLADRWLDRRAGLAAELGDGVVMARPKQRRAPATHPVMTRTALPSSARATQQAAAAPASFLAAARYAGLPSDPLAMRRGAAGAATTQVVPSATSPPAESLPFAVPDELPVTPAVAAAWTYLPPAVAKTLEGDPFASTLDFVDENRARVERLFKDRDMRLTLAEVETLLLARAVSGAAASERSRRHFRAMLSAGGKGDLGLKELRAALEGSAKARAMVRRGVDGGGGERAATEIHAGEVLKRLGLFMAHAEHAERAFAKFDADKSGYLEPAEQLQLIRHVMPGLVEGVLRYVLAYLDSLDTDGDGRLSFSELKAAASGERAPPREATQLQPMTVIPAAFPVPANADGLPVNMLAFHPTVGAAGAGGGVAGDMQAMQVAGAAEAQAALAHAAAAAQAASRAASLAAGAGDASARLGLGGPAAGERAEAPTLQARAAAAAAQAEALGGAASVASLSVPAPAARRVPPSPALGSGVAAMSVEQVSAFVRGLGMDPALFSANSVSGADLLTLSDNDLKEHLALTVLQLRKLRRAMAEASVPVEDGRDSAVVGETAAAAAAVEATEPVLPATRYDSQ